MTTIISLLGILGRALGRVLTSSLGWATGLLYGRVPKDHQVFVEAMFGASVLWTALGILLLVPTVLSFVLATTPFARSVGLALIRALFVGGLLGLPLLVGVASLLVPAASERPRGLAAAWAVLRGYPLTILLAGIALFLPLAGLARRLGSLRRGWADIHVPILARPAGYDAIVDHVERALSRHDIVLERRPAPMVFEIPGRVLALIAGRHVADVLPDRMVELRGKELEVGVYPSDIVISGGPTERLLARATIMSSLAQASAHLTISAESQEVEDRIEVIARPSTPTLDALAEVDAIDRDLARLDVSSADWDILFRLRLQAERDVLRRA